MAVLMTGLAGAGLTAGTAVAEPGVIVIQGTCGQVFHPILTGGEAGWTVTCGGGTVRAQGWVKDTKADGKGAEVYGAWGDNASFGTVRAGGNGKRVTFNKSHAGTVVNLYLRVS
ncbi:hypothetical protein APASM_3437 [Actinosynnema pretiosum subsp. pretiosum]|nr:hypothetical protein APASM_3437 [Actinosynnema pretiosum subsp. pretiosum]